jgi:hypothetical protein
MNREDIIRMAEEAGIHTYPKWMHGIPIVTLERFFQAAYDAGAAAEREACAKVAELVGQDKNHHGIAAAIRARGQA